MIKYCSTISIWLLLVSLTSFVISQHSPHRDSSPSLWSSLGSIEWWTHNYKVLSGYVDSLAKEDCEEFTCAKDEMLESNAEHSAVGNGCGSFGYTVDKYIADGMIDCCNDHDLCFGKCGAKKTKCDEKFKKCLYQVCREDESRQTSKTVCQISAKLLYGATTLAGCSSFHAAQSQACICRPRTGTSSRSSTQNHRHNRREL